MRTNQNKVLMIVLIAIAIIAIVGGGFAYLFFATDMFKSGQELFATYLMQNVEDVKQITQIEKLKEIESKLGQAKYEEKLTVSCSEPSESDEVLKLTIDTQKDSTTGKIYSLLGLLLPNQEEELKLEYMQENDMYSLRFTNAVKQFLTVQNSELKKLAKNLGVDEEEIEVIPNTIDFEEFSFDEINFTEEEISTELNKYATLLFDNIAKEKYKKNKDVVITVKGKTITTNAYVLTLSEKEVNDLLIKVLETFKQDEVILSKLEKIDEKLEEYSEESIKDSFIQGIQDEIDTYKEEEIIEESNFMFVVYEANKETIRIKLEKDLNYIIIDTAENQVDITYTSMDEENTQYSIKTTLVKENDNKLNITVNNIEGEEQTTTNARIEVTENEGKTKIDIVAELETFEIYIGREIEILDEIDFKVTLEKSNNIILNNLSSTQLTSIFSQLGEKLETEYVEPLEDILEPIMLLMMLNGMEQDTNTDNVEAEIFNSTFQLYEGENIPVEEVNMLLDTVFNHNKAEDLKIEPPHYITVSGEISLSSDADKSVQMRGNKEYNIECKLDENGYINEIVITEATEQE